MPDEAAARWNKRYQTEDCFTSTQPRDLLLEYTHLLPSQGLALDIAMGMGGNAGLLLSHGLRVIGVDISWVAVSQAKNHHHTLMGVVADMQQFLIPRNKFDVIVDFLYLQRDLWSSMIHGLKKGGILFIECLTQDMLVTHPEINPIFLLKQGELQQTFINSELGKHLEIIHYYEGWYSPAPSHRRAIARMVARKVA